MADPIEHVVVLMLENHSFDQMLGALTAVYPDLDGVKVGSEHSNQGMDANRDPRRQHAYLQSITVERQMMLDPRHEVEHVAVQLENNNSGFVRDFQQSNDNDKDENKNWKATQCGQIMNYYELDRLPALHGLGRKFTVCDRWFSSLPGPTWPNRFFALSGTSNGQVDMPEKSHWDALAGFFLQFQPTIFDRLNEKGISWNVFYDDFPVSLILDNQRMNLGNRQRYKTMDVFHEAASKTPSSLPQFSYIEPRYTGYDQNDDHPPHDVMKAQNLIADIYNSIRANEELWHKTLFIVFYDEHGGYYDHVVPPKAIPPDDLVGNFKFDQLGIRVPALLISPWVDAGVDHTIYDHTSMLRYLQNKWNLGNLGRRTANANSFERIIRTTAPRSDTPTRIEKTASDPIMDAQAVNMDSAHHTALAAFSYFLNPAFTQTYIDHPEYFDAAKVAVADFLKSHV